MKRLFTDAERFNVPGVIYLLHDLMSTTTKTEFVSAEFETEVSDEGIASFVSTLEDCVAELRQRIKKDETAEELLRGGPGRKKQYKLRGSMSVEGQDPEPLTMQTFIEPILDELGYERLLTEISGVSAEREKLADYSYPLDDDRIDSRQLLVEAEPLNKKLEGRGHGIDQVENWLSRREFESDFGFATDGKRWVFVRYDPDSYSHDRIEDIDLRDVLLSLFHNLTGRRDPSMEVLSAEEYEIIEAFLQTFKRDNFVSIAADSRQVIREKQEEITEEFYDAYIRIVFGVQEGDEERSPRSLVNDGVIAPDEATGEDTRLFAVKTMNRLIFVKFLEDRSLVSPNLLSDLSKMYGDGKGHTQSLYQEFIDPLFFEVMNLKPNDRSKQVKNVDDFQDIPYLNGGLFHPYLGERQLDEREFDVENSVLKEVIGLLERYNFSAEGGPTDLDPSVLGNVFEKTINYLTADPGNKEELGAYYTPKEITRFCAEETVRPALRERFEDWLVEERGWKEAEVEYETVYELIDDLPSKTSLVTEALDEVVDELRVVDPAMGSGHFLTSVLEEIVSVRRALYDKIRDEDDEGDEDDSTTYHRLKKTTVQHNIHGIDIVDPAVEIGKLRLWLSVISELHEEDLEDLNIEEFALPNIRFNIRQGNSLIGYVRFPEETEDGLTTFERWSEDSVRSRYEDVIEQIELYEEHSAFPEQAEHHRNQADELLTEYRKELDENILADIRKVVDGIGEDDLEEYEPFHWLLEFAKVYAEGGFDVIVGNPPWDRLRPTRDDFFVRYDEGFMSLPPNAKDARQEDLLGDPDISEAWGEYQHEIEVVSQYFHESTEYQMQTPEVDGSTQGTENDLSALFLERVFNLVKQGGYAAQVLPGSVFNAASTKDLRMHLLDETEIQSLIHFENRGTFDIGTQYNYGILTFKNEGRTETLNGIFKERSPEVLSSIEERTLRIPRSVMARYSPEARTFPYVRSQQEVEVLDSIVSHPPIGESEQNSWYAQPYRELDRTNDSDRFTENSSEGDYPVLGGSNIWQFVYDSQFYDLDEIEFWSVDEDDPSNSAKYRIREKNLRKLKKGIYEAFDGSGSQIQFVDNLLEEKRGKPLSEEDVLLDCTEYRIVFRDVARASQERSITAAVIPKGYVCHNTLHTVRPYEINPDESNLHDSPLHSVYDRVFTDKELLAALGLINSIPFDYLLRSKIDLHIVMYKFTESQVPNITEGDQWFEYIWRRSAKMNCYGDEFEEMRSRLNIKPATSDDARTQLQSELDAAAFHAYGLNRNETEFVLDDFYQVEDPILMTDRYLELVLEKYNELAD